VEAQIYQTLEAAAFLLALPGGKGRREGREGGRKRREDGRKEKKVGRVLSTHLPILPSPLPPFSFIPPLPPSLPSFLPPSFRHHGCPLSGGHQADDPGMVCCLSETTPDAPS